jgi:diguanylate cyclase (GGDEF)-like protein
MAKPLRVLHIEDSEMDAQLLLRELRRGGYEITFERVDTAAAMMATLARAEWDIVISDYTMPNFSGPAALKLLQESELDLPFIIVSGSIGEDIAVAAMKAGAHDYIMKNNLTRLIPAIEREMREAIIRRERRQVEALIQHLAYYDPLTDLPNRTTLLDRLQQAILAGLRENKTVALLLIDLNNFNEINNTLGHHNGDMIIQGIGPRLKNLTRQSDTIARLEGDKFAMLLPGAGVEGATLIANKIMKALEEPFLLEKLTLEVGVSIGIAIYPDHGLDASAIMQRADVAMYLAKQAGDEYFIYASEKDEYKPNRLALMGELRQAIDRDQLFLLYQPKIDMKSCSLSGVEALVRWQHPQRGLIPPDQFIMLAEKTGMIKQLTLWVLNAALRQSRAWHQDGIQISVAVNLSARNLQDIQFPNLVKGLLETWKVPSSRLDLEITESTIMMDPLRAMDILTRLNQMGVRLSIDDFGTGYSSLGYLKKLPVDEIKIDKSFVMRMAADKDDAMIVRSTVDLAHNLGLKVVAEGVENQDVWEKLSALGCDTAQGYYMSRPISSEDFMRWIRESSWGLKGTPGKIESDII